MNAAALRVDPRRPALLTPSGLRRIVLGSNEGERLARTAPAAAGKPLRSAGPFTGCIVVAAHTDRGALDEHALEVIAAAAVLARPDEAVVLLALGDCRDDLAALAVDRAEVLALPASSYCPQALTAWLQARLLALRPRHLLLPDRGPDADLGRRLAALAESSAATRVVELTAERLRVRAAGARDACAPLPRLMLLERHTASTKLPFVGQGAVEQAPALPHGAENGVQDLGIEPGDARSVPLEEADFILAAGNGVRDVALFERLAQALGAATGASRVAVDDGRFARDKQIGATGKSVQARGYLAIGISGAVQHLQGIKECRHVIAVNTDASAPIAQRAELTVMADAQALMLALLERVESQRAAAASVPAVASGAIASDSVAQPGVTPACAAPAGVASGLEAQGPSPCGVGGHDGASGPAGPGATAAPPAVARAQGVA